MMTPPVLTCVCWLVLLVPGVRNSGEFQYKHSSYFVIPENLCFRSSYKMNYEDIILIILKIKQGFIQTLMK